MTNRTASTSAISPDGVPRAATSPGSEKGGSDSTGQTGLPSLQIRHLAKSFGGAHALRDVSLDILPGEVHGLIGENGSGKSTPIQVLAGYHAASSTTGGADLTYVQAQLDKYMAIPTFAAPGSAFGASKAAGKTVFNIPQTSAIEFLQMVTVRMSG